MMPRGKNGYSWELNSGTQDSEVRFIHIVPTQLLIGIVKTIKWFYQVFAAE